MSELGQLATEFPNTSWGMVSGLKSTDPAARRSALHTLVSRYWRPIYAYIRKKLGKNHEDAEDLTQAFLHMLIEKEPLRSFDPSVGTFRQYLKGILKNASSDIWDKERAWKRGGRVKIVSLDLAQAPMTDQAQLSPDEVFDLAFFEQILERALATAKKWFDGKQQAYKFAIYEQYDLSPVKVTCGQLAKKYAVPEGSVRHIRWEVRERVHLEALNQLADTVASRQALEREWKLYSRK